MYHAHQICPGRWASSFKKKLVPPLPERLDLQRVAKLSRAAGARGGRCDASQSKRAAVTKLGIISRGFRELVSRGRPGVRRLTQGTEKCIGSGMYPPGYIQGILDELVAEGKVTCDDKGVYRLAEFSDDQGMPPADPEADSEF
jgi:hypothetical protein